MANNSRADTPSSPSPGHEAFEGALRKSNADWFAERGLPVNPRSPYLLENWKDWPSNLILPEVASYIQAEQERRSNRGERFPLHQYIHNGLSSQAMLFNLVGPLTVYEDLTPFKLALASAGIDWPPEPVEAVFEIEDRRIFNEDVGQPTSIDLVLYGLGRARSLFIEAKLVEREFGGCSVFQGKDCDGQNPSKDFSHCYLHSIGRLYWDLLEKHGFLSGLLGASPICPLALYYQFFRELLFALESGGEFVLLYDQRNPAFYAGGAKSRGLMPFLVTFVPPELRSRVHSITIQHVVESYKRGEGFPWLAEFEKKYALAWGRLFGRTATKIQPA
jgi:Restriction Endonuclease associating with ARP